MYNNTNNTTTNNNNNINNNKGHDDFAVLGQFGAKIITLRP